MGPRCGLGLARAVVILVAVGVVAGCSGGNSESALDADLGAKLQQTLDQARVRAKVPGAAAAVIVDGQGEWTGASGKADLGSGEPVTPETLFGIGSVTKSFVAALVLELDEEGLLSIDDRLSRWLPAYPRADRITLRQLLNHTSGVPDFTDVTRFWRAQRERPFARWSPERTLSFVRGSDFEPGHNQEYSNTNYILLGLVVEKATGSSVAEELERRILDPLELDSLRLQTTDAPIGRAARAYGDYDDDGKRDAAPSRVTLVPSPAVATAAWTAGAMVGTAVDLARWADALFGGRVLAPASLREMQSPPQCAECPRTPADGLGVAKTRVLIKTRVLKRADMWGHEGEIDGYRAAMWTIPSRGITVVTLWNDSTVEGNPIESALLDAVLAA
jgi:D-alanyl-D-alanine carboxypeptidase